MTGRCTRWERWLPGSGGGLKVLDWNLHSFQLLEIIQVLDSISWVRCASGNVFEYERGQIPECFCTKKKNEERLTRSTVENQYQRRRSSLQGGGGYPPLLGGDIHPLI